MGAISQLLYRPKEKVRVVNLKDFRGTDSNSENWIYAYGFDKDGFPVVNEKKIGSCTYRLCGGFMGSIALMPMIDKGKTLGELLGISESEANAMIQPLRNVKSIFFVKQHNLYGMVDHYNCDDKWMVTTGDIPQPDYNEFNDRILKKINSPWRIYTSKVSQLLRKLEYQQIMGLES